MATFRVTPCKYYLCKESCLKGRYADYQGYCQKCNLYIPRCKEKHINKKKRELDKISRKEEREY